MEAGGSAPALPFFPMLGQLGVFEAPAEALAFYAGDRKPASGAVREGPGEAQLKLGI